MGARRPPAFFISGSTGLDFLNTLATPVDVQVDWIDDGDGLLAWLREAQLVPTDALKALKRQAIPGELDGVAARARDLREWFRGFVRARSGRNLGAHDLRDLEPLNHLLDRDERFGRIVAGAGGEAPALRIETVRRWRSPESLLLPIGEAIAECACNRDFRHIKACEGTTCTLLFLDRTRGQARRWCSMEVCGNRAKQAALRDRRKAVR
ncbi:MAG: CGNR zinc finger domain-containing protein [Isosphaeraceae bacterium]